MFTLFFDVIMNLTEIGTGIKVHSCAKHEYIIDFKDSVINLCDKFYKTSKQFHPSKGHGITMYKYVPN